MKRRIGLSAVGLVLGLCAAPLRADIFQWEYVDPDDPAQGVRQSATLAPEGAGIDAVPGAFLVGRDLSKAYLNDADLRMANFKDANLTDAVVRGAEFAPLIHSFGLQY